MKTLLLCALLSTAPVQDPAAQDPAAQDVAPAIDAREVARKALTQLAESGAAFTAEVERYTAASDAPGGGGFAIAIGPGDFGGGEAFEGKALGQLDADGVIWLASEAPVPGFQARLADEDLVRTTYRDAPLDVSQSLLELGALIDPLAVERKARKAEWAAMERGGESGGWFLHARLDASLIPSASGPMGFEIGFGEKVMHVDVELDVDAAGALQGATFEVVRSD